MNKIPDTFGPIALVTGSSSGIGRAIALELARAGADVLVHARKSLDAAAEVADEVKRMGRTSDVIAADLSIDVERQRLAEAAWAWRGRLDILVNNAGVDLLTGPLAHLDFDSKVAAAWQVDALATFSLSREIGKRMRKHGGGSIVNIGWDQAEHGMGGDSGELFAAVKGAVMAFTRSLAVSLAPQVRVNCVAPGWIRTAWGQTAGDYWQRRAAGESQLRRWGQPEDVARAVRFLASPAAGFVTGQIVTVNGGFCAADETYAQPE